MTSIYENIERIRDRINEAAIQSGRNPSSIHLLAISKTHPVETIMTAHKAGLDCFGENRIQEAENKIKSLSNLHLKWHLVGPLQSNKVKKAAALFDLIHTVDRTKIIRALEKEGETLEKRIQILIQVNVGEEPQKSGVLIDDIEQLVEILQLCQWVQCNGFMTVPPYHEDPESVRPYFAKLREMSDRYKSQLDHGEGRWELSMGMSHDFQVAIQEGASIVRLGTALFGERKAY